MMKLFLLIQTEVATLDEAGEYAILYKHFNDIITKYENWQSDNF